MTPSGACPVRIVLTGCSGGGKSSLLGELSRRGFAIVPEPGRRIVEAETDPNSERLPWNNLAGFAATAVGLAEADYDRAAETSGPVFFDRGLIDALSALCFATAEPFRKEEADARPYGRGTFFVPPWPEIWETDASRRHAFDDAVAEYRRLLETYSDLGYSTHILPKVSIAERADIVLRAIDCP